MGNISTAVNRKPEKNKERERPMVLGGANKQTRVRVRDPAKCGDLEMRKGEGNNPKMSA